jgi:hypothetical protein
MQRRRETRRPLLVPPSASLRLRVSASSFSGTHTFACHLSSPPPKKILPHEGDRPEPKGVSGGVSPDESCPENPSIGSAGIISTEGTTEWKAGTRGDPYG